MNSNWRGRRLLALLLAVVLTVSVLPAYSMEAEETSVCLTCGEDPCTCEPAEVCDVCEADPCVCEDLQDACEECGGSDAHAETCSQYVASSEDADEAGETAESTEETEGEDTTEGEETTEEETTLCETCGQDPCTCEPVEENCPDCGDIECICADLCPSCGELECVCPSLYEQMMAAESVEDMYLLLLTDMESAYELSEDELQKLYDYATVLNEEMPSSDYADLVDALQYLAGDYDLNGAEILAEYVDEKTFNSSTTISTAWTVQDTEDNGTEANWKLAGGITLTINSTVTIPAGETLDIYVKSTEEDATIKFGSNGKFVVYGTLKICYGNDSYTKGVTINGGTINVNDGGKVFLERITAITGTAAWNLSASNATLRLYGDVPVTGTLAISGNGTDSIVKAYGDVESMFVVNDGGKLTLYSLTVDAGAEDSTERNNRILYIKTQTDTDDDYEFTATDCCFQNAYKDDPIFKIFSNADTKIVGGTITNCRTSTTEGVIQLSSNKDSDETVDTKHRTLYIDGTTITECASEGEGSAGGIIRTNGTTKAYVTIKDSKFSNNYSGGWGNILWNAKGTCQIEGCTFESNESKRRGGAISSEGEGLEIENCTFIGNKAGEYGGAICMFPYTLTGKDEGATELAMTVTIGEGCKFENNSAPIGGAVAILIQETKSTLPTILTASVDLGNEGYMKNNIASDGGGAIYAGCTAEDALSDTKINLNINSGTIQNNSAVTGGAIFVDDIRTGNTGVNTVTVAGGLITNNSATNGGAIGIEAGNFVMSGGEVTGNTATNNGGGVYVAGGSVTMSGGTLSGNKADGNGGAAYVTGGDFTMSGGTMASNKASGNGGAAYVSGGSFTLTDGTLGGSSTTGNSAESGGAVYVDGAGSFTMTSGTMSYNTAEVTGGAVSALGGTISIGINGCNSEGEYHSVTGYTDKQHPEVIDNAAGAGGGLYVGNSGIVNLYCGTLKNNQVPTNALGQNVYMDGGTFSYYGGTIGVTTDPGIVIVGGSFVDHVNKSSDNADLIYSINYIMKTDNGTILTVTGSAPLNSYFNLPDAATNEKFQMPDAEAGECGWTRDGYVFVGWAKFPSKSIDPTNGNYISSDKDYTPAGGAFFTGSEDKIDLYAVWAPLSNSITFIPNDGFLSSDGLSTYEYSASVTNENVITLETPTREGYTFAGWLLTSNTGKDSNWGDWSDQEKWITAGTLNYGGRFGEIILTAQWTINQYTITFDTAGGSGVDPITQDYGTEITKPDNPTRYGYKFVGWKPEVPNTMPAENITITAQWTVAYSTLTIQVVYPDGANYSIDGEQTFLFDVHTETGNDAVDMTVTVLKNGSVIIDDVTIGNTYTVSMQDAWSWRYGEAAAQKITIKEDETQNVVTFTVTRTNDQWLDGNAVYSDTAATETALVTTYAYVGKEEEEDDDGTQN